MFKCEWHPFRESQFGAYGVYSAVSQRLSFRNHAREDCGFLVVGFPNVCVCECRSPMRVSGGDWWGHSGAEAALTWESARTLGAFGCFIMMSLCCIAASGGAALYSEAERILQTLPLFFARLFFSVSLSLPVGVSFILFFVLFPPAGHRIPQNPPFVPFFTLISPLLLSGFVSLLSLPVALQLNRLMSLPRLNLTLVDDTAKTCYTWHSNKGARVISLKGISIAAIVSHIKGFWGTWTESGLCKYTSTLAAHGSRDGVVYVVEEALWRVLFIQVRSTSIRWKLWWLFFSWVPGNMTTWKIVIWRSKFDTFAVYQTTNETQIS